VLERMRELVVPVIVRITYATSTEGWGGTIIDSGSGPLSDTHVSLRFGNGETMETKTDGNGDVAIPVTRLGQSVTASAFGMLIGPGATSSKCELKARTGNSIRLSYHKPIDINPFDPRRRK